MTSAYMQLRAEQYEPFLEMPLGNYRAARIDPANQEIDQIGLQALTDAVIAPANFALEVLYLDRSIGESVTPHPFVADYLNKPTIRLLYRPGHYDIIYKDNTPTQVFLQRSNLIPQEMQLSDYNGVSGELQPYLFSGPPATQSHSANSSFYSVDHGSNTQSRSHQGYLFSPHPQPSCMHFDMRQTHPVPMMTVDFSHTYPLQYSSPSSTDISLSPPHSTTPVMASRPAPSVKASSKNPTEPQIRLNANCFNYSLRHESVPLCLQNYGR